MLLGGLSQGGHFKSCRELLQSAIVAIRPAEAVIGAKEWKAKMG